MLPIFNLLSFLLFCIFYSFVDFMKFFHYFFICFFLIMIIFFRICEFIFQLHVFDYSVDTVLYFILGVVVLLVFFILIALSQIIKLSSNRNSFFNICRNFIHLRTTAITRCGKIIIINNLFIFSTVRLGGFLVLITLGGLIWRIRLFFLILFVGCSRLFFCRWCRFLNFRRLRIFL